MPTTAVSRSWPWRGTPVLGTAHLKPRLRHDVIVVVHRMGIRIRHRRDDAYASAIYPWPGAVVGGAGFTRFHLDSGEPLGCDCRALRIYIHVQKPAQISLGAYQRSKSGDPEMTLSLALACVWALIANVLAMTPSKDNHWRRAYFLIGIGIPLLGYVTYENGPWVGLIVLVAGMSVLRWPVYYLTRWVKGRVEKG